MPLSIRDRPPLGGWRAAIAIFVLVVAQGEAWGAEVPGASTAARLDELWVLVATALVFLMQAGFKCLEVGLTQKKSSTSVAMKNLIDWVICTLFFFLFGFGLLFGRSWAGLSGTSLFAPEALGAGLGFTFFLFQAAFAGTSTTIVSGAMAERTSFMAYLVGCVWLAAFVYPIYGHWAWSGLLDPANQGWLQRLGFIDFAGSSVVHSTGGWFALVGVYLVGPRRGRFDGAGQVMPLRPQSMAYAALGVFLLWIGWWGFNGGSTLVFDASVAPVILNTNLAAAMGALVAFAHAQAVPGRKDVAEKLIGGALGGLVAITACCHLVSPRAALAIGGMAGLIHNLSYDLLLYRLKLDDPVGAIPVHGFCGIWGTLSVALFGRAEMLPQARGVQLLVQAVGAVACFAWAGANAALIYGLMQKTVGLRVGATEEELGVELTPDLLAQRSGSTRHHQSGTSG